MKVNGYKFGNKNNWRRWVWNRIDERRQIPRKDCVILYLAGEEDLDRPVAVSKGYDPNNLIAVEKDYKTYEKLKSKGIVCINGDFNEAIRSFSKSKVKPNILIADFCCGITDTALEFVNSIITMNSLDRKCVVMANFMRGRDSHIDTMKEYSQGFMGDVIKDEKNMHRGKIFLSMFDTVHEMISSGFNVEFKKIISQGLFALHRNGNKSNGIEDMLLDDVTEHIDVMLDVLRSPPEELQEQFDDIINGDESFASKFCANSKKWDELNEDDGELVDLFYKFLIQATLDPCFTSYKSGNIVMDSCVFNLNEFHRHHIEVGDVNKDFHNRFKAAMAIRTMRSNGKLKPCPSN